MTQCFTMVHPPGLHPQRSGNICFFIHLHQVIVLHTLHQSLHKYGEVDQCRTKLHNLRPDPQLQLKNILISKNMTQYLLPQLSKLVSNSQNSSKDTRYDLLRSYNTYLYYQNG
jgi:hypothetical protein